MAIQEFMPNAKEGSCVYHIVNQGMDCKGPGKNMVKTGWKQQRYLQYRNIVTKWLNSWMSPYGAETEEEYILSK